MFYENSDYYVPITVSLIVLPGSNVAQTQTPRSILAADSTTTKAHCLPKGHRSKTDLRTGWDPQKL